MNFPAHPTPTAAQLQAALQARQDLRDLGLDAQVEAQAFARQASEQIDRQVLVLALQAQLTASAFWSATEAFRSLPEKTERSFLGCRVRVVNGSLSIEWYRNAIFKPPGAQSKRVLSSYIKKGAGTRYPKTSFAKEPEWAKKLVELAEDDFQAIRERAAALTKMRRALREFEKQPRG